MISLVDIGAGLWMYAHNSTNPLYGGWWNDLDMIEIGNGDGTNGFQCEANAESLARCQVHFTMWTIMKAPLILGNNIPEASAATLAVLNNAEAIAVNQDSLGVQAQRVSAVSSVGDALLAGSVVAVAAPCNPSRPTQAWTWLGDSLTTTDAEGTRWCVVDAHGTEDEGSWRAVPCAETTAKSRITVAASTVHAGTVALVTPLGGSLTVNNQEGASGPTAHTRYVTSDLLQDPSATWYYNGAALMARDRSGLRNDDKAGKVATGGDWCLDLAPDADQEVWAGPLAGGKWAVALLNRNPLVASTITAQWSMFGAHGSFAVHDIWQGKDVGTFASSYQATVPPHAVVYVVLTPA